MAKGKRISEQPIIESLNGDELIPFAKNGANGAVEANTIKEFVSDGLENTYATNERVNDLLDGFAPKSWLASTDQEVSRINNALMSGLSYKVDKEDGKGLSSNDFTDEDKAKLDRFELVLANDDEIENGLAQIASSEDYRTELKKNGYVVYHDVKFKVKDCGVTSASIPWLITEGAVITDNEEGELFDHTQGNFLRSMCIWFDGYLVYQPYDTAVNSEAIYIDEISIDDIDNALNSNAIKSLELTDEKANSLALKLKKATSQGVSVYLKRETERGDDKLQLTNIQSTSVNGNTAFIAGVMMTNTLNDDNATYSKICHILIADNDVLIYPEFVPSRAELNNKVDKEEGKGLSSNDYTDTDKAKVDSLGGTYLPLSGGTIDGGANAIPLKVDSTQDTAAIQFDNSGIAKGNVGWNSVHGSVLFNYPSNKVLGVKDDGTPHYDGKKLMYANGTDSQFVKADGSLDSTDYVPKEEGKQLSTEDFTTLLKSKLEQLGVDVPDIDARLTALQTSLDTILDSDNATNVIDTFQEIENFLQGVTNTQTLTGLLQEMKSEIVQLCANTYVPLNRGVFWRAAPDGSVTTMRFIENDAARLAINKYIECWQNYGEGAGWFSFKAGKFIVKDGTSSQFLKADGSVDSTAYLPKSGGELTGGLFVNSTSPTIRLKEENESKGVWQYNSTESAIWISNSTSGYAIKLFDDNSLRYGTYTIWHAGNDGSGSGLDADLLDGLEATNYMLSQNKSGVDLNTIVKSGAYRLHNNNINVPSSDYYYGQLLVIHGSSDTIAQMCFASVGTKVAIRHGNPSVIGGSGNWSSWRELAATDSNVASANKLTTKLLTNEDLNTLKDINFSNYSANGNNSITNSPIGNYGFYLQVFGLNGSSNYISQVLTHASTGEMYKRALLDGTWTPWQQLATTDGAVAKLTTKQLTNEDLNDIKDDSFSCYYTMGDNTCSNKPSGVTGFKLQVLKGIVSNVTIQILIDSNTGVIYKRLYATTWTAWKKLLTEDDLPKSWVGTEAQYNAITTKDANTVYYIKE